MMQTLFSLKTKQNGANENAKTPFIKRLRNVVETPPNAKTAKKNDVGTVQNVSQNARASQKVLGI